MKLYLPILLLSALIQTSFLPLNLCLIFLICKSFETYDQANFYLAFIAGLMLGILGAVNLGFWPLTFLMVVWITHTLKKLPLVANFLIILPISFLIISLVSFTQSLIFAQKLPISLIAVETILTLPALLAVRFWEERFIPKNEIKLKLKQ